MNYWSFEDWKQNQIDSVNDRNNTSAWHKAHPKKADTSIFSYINDKVQFIIRQYEPVVNIDLSFDSL